MPETPDDAPTELIPAAETGDGLAGTRELPAVGAEPPTEVVAPVTEAPAAATAEPPTEAMAPPTAAVTEAPTEAGPEPPAEAVAEPPAEEPPAEAAESPAEDVADPPTEAMAPPTGAAPEPPADEPPADEPPADEPPVETAESPAEVAADPPADTEDPRAEEPAPELPEPPEVAAAVAAGVSPDVARSLAQAEPPRDPAPRRRPPDPQPDPQPDPDPAPLDLLPSREVSPPERESALTAVRRGWGPRATVLAVLLLLVVLVVVIRPDGSGGDETAARPTPTPAAAVTIPAELSSVDPSGGTGLRQEGDRWRTQSYNSAEFGNLKDGVGLLLDLGAPRAVGTVSLNVEGPLAIELRAGDEPGAVGDAFKQVSAAPNASGDTSLDGSKGGEHRYWLVWVTRLASGDGGYRAVLGTPVVRGPAK